MKTHPKFYLRHLPDREIKAVVIGGSAGSLKPLRFILSQMPSVPRLPIIIVVHRGKHDKKGLLRFLSSGSASIKEPEDGELIKPGINYLAPSGYHLLVKSRLEFSFSRAAPVRGARPSIDKLFQTAAEVFGTGLVGVILSGCGSDGALGLKRIREKGGMGIIQKPDGAEFDFMSKAAIKAGGVNKILNLEQIAFFLSESTSSEHILQAF